jgi:hypothetical protein
MALDSSFAAGVLAGMEGTLEELIERVDGAELRASLDVLHSRVVALRVSIEPPAREPNTEREAEPVPAETV